MPASPRALVRRPRPMAGTLPHVHHGGGGSLATKIAATIGGSLLGLLVLNPVPAAAAVAAQANPPGNNGTIKTDGVEFDDHPNNEPHVGCTFQVDFYGYDEGDLFADVTFKAHPPTLRPGNDQTVLTDTVFIGEDDNSGGGSEAGLDASETYTLDFTGITPHSVQGFHVKLTIHADGSQGADTKHKVFWVEGCVPSTTKPPTTPPGEESTPPGEESTPPGEESTPPGENKTTAAGEILPVTGTGYPMAPAVLVALLMLGGGAALLRWNGVLRIPYRRRH